MPDDNFTRDEIRDLTVGWWLLAGTGLLGVAAGVIVLTKPSDSLTTLTVIAGIFVLIEGIAELVASFSRDTQYRGLAAIMGVLSLVIGILLIRHPVGGVQAVVVLVGIWLVAVGAVRVVGAFESEHRVRHFIVAALEIAAGIVIVSSPSIGYATLALLVGISFIVNGLGLFVLGWAMHGLRHDATAGPPRGAAKTA